MTTRKPKGPKADAAWLASANEKLRRAGHHRRGVAWWSQTITILAAIAGTAGRIAKHPDFADVFDPEELSRFSAQLWDHVTALADNRPAPADVDLIDPIEKVTGRATDLPSRTAR